MVAVHMFTQRLEMTKSFAHTMSAESVMLSTISSSVSPFSSCPQSFPASGSFPMSWFFVSSGQSIGASASASVLLMNTQELISFKIDWLDLLAVQGTLKSLLQHHNLKTSTLWCSAFFMVQLITFPGMQMTIGKTIVLTI